MFLGEGALRTVAFVSDKQLSIAKEGQSVPRELEEINRNLPKPVKPNVVKASIKYARMC